MEIMLTFAISFLFKVLFKNSFIEDGDEGTALTALVLKSKVH